jgi:DNA-binding response OmpR family regulator
MPAKLEGRHILVADDDPDVLASLRLAFESAGARVTSARDGNQAVELTKKTDPDLVVLDMMMPKRSGFLVMENIKPSHDAETRPYVIMITANEGKRHELYARHLGVSDYLTKPFSMERLMERTCQLLGGEYVDPDAV